ncbi:MAG: hypothetical protein IPK34_10215 [Ramlibacter sp.]|nr:hypothetical protein [Ramlibacter sp.]
MISLEIFLQNPNGLSQLRFSDDCPTKHSLIYPRVVPEITFADSVPTVAFAAVRGGDSSISMLSLRKIALAVPLPAMC